MVRACPDPARWQDLVQAASELPRSSCGGAMAETTGQSRVSRHYHLCWRTPWLEREGTPGRLSGLPHRGPDNCFGPRPGSGARVLAWWVNPTGPTMSGRACRATSGPRERISTPGFGAYLEARLSHRGKQAKPYRRIQST
jgi:hypothetical protein